MAVAIGLTNSRCIAKAAKIEVKLSVLSSLRSANSCKAVPQSASQTLPVSAPTTSSTIAFGVGIQRIRGLFNGIQGATLGDACLQLGRTGFNTFANPAAQASREIGEVSFNRDDRLHAMELPFP